MQVEQVHIPVVAQRQFHMVQTARRVLDDPVVLVVRVHRCRRGEDSRAPTVALGEKLVMLRPLRVWALLGAAHHPVEELMGRCFRALYTGAGPGVVSTGTWPP